MYSKIGFLALQRHFYQRGMADVVYMADYIFLHQISMNAWSLHVYPVILMLFPTCCYNWLFIATFSITLFLLFPSAPASRVTHMIEILKRFSSVFLSLCKGNFSSLVWCNLLPNYIVPYFKYTCFCAACLLTPLLIFPRRTHFCWQCFLQRHSQ